ncbi:MAG: autotransporter-associated beta strand repeat-containing protein, partial [Betaproteobacteria bacterium]
NAANTYSGVTTVLSGTLVAGSSTAFGPSGTAALRFGDASTGRVQLNGSSVTVTGLNSSSVLGAPILESGSATVGTDTLTINNTTASAYAGLLQDGGARKLGLTKSGAGVLTLSGQNTFTGLTTVSGGTLAYGASNALGSGDVTVSGATAALSLGQFSDTVGIVILDNGGWQAVKEAVLRVYPDGASAAADEFHARLQGATRRFEKIGEAFGAYGECLIDPAEVEPAIARCLQALESGRSAVLNVQIGLQ